MKLFIHISILILLGFALNACNSGVKKIKKLDHDLNGFNVITDLGNCSVVFDQIDRLTGDRKTDLKEEVILRYTHPKLRKYFDEEPFVIVYSGLSRINKKQFLCNFTFDLYAKSLQQNYLGIEEGSYLKIRLINGEEIILQGITSSDVKNIVPGRKQYSASFLIKPSDINQLKDYEIDFIGVTWIGGFETYPVHEIDYLMRQFECFSKLK